MLAREDGDALVIGQGVPPGWMSQAFGVDGMPTQFGRLSYQYDPSAREVTLSVERMPIGGVRAAFPAEVSMKVRQALE